MGHRPGERRENKVLFFFLYGEVFLNLLPLENLVANQPITAFSTSSLQVESPSLSSHLPPLPPFDPSQEQCSHPVREQDTEVTLVWCGLP